MPREPITITLPDGSTRDGTSYESSPMSVAISISKGLADKTVIAKVRTVSLSGFVWRGGELTPCSSSSSPPGRRRAVGPRPSVREVGVARASRL